MPSINEEVDGGETRCEEAKKCVIRLNIRCQIFGNFSSERSYFQHKIGMNFRLGMRIVLVRPYVIQYKRTRLSNISNFSF